MKTMTMACEDLREASESRPGFRWRDLANRQMVAEAVGRTLRWTFDRTRYSPARIVGPDLIVGYYSLPRVGIYGYRYKDGSVGPADRFRVNPPTRTPARMLDQDFAQADVTTGINWRDTAVTQR